MDGGGVASGRVYSIRYRDDDDDDDGYDIVPACVRLRLTAYGDTPTRPSKGCRSVGRPRYRRSGGGSARRRRDDRRHDHVDLYPPLGAIDVPTRTVDTRNIDTSNE